MVIYVQAFYVYTIGKIRTDGGFATLTVISFFNILVESLKKS